MFFRRDKPAIVTFDDRLRMLNEAGFQTRVQPGGRTRVVRGQCAAEIEDNAGSPEVAATGLLMKDEIGALVDLGYQKIFQTPSGKRMPARAAHLKALHAFDQDLRELLGLKSLYNESLGTTNQAHLYDRVEGRDHQHS
jgi:hypothetical protein